MQESTRTYRVHSLFYTVQGEGTWTGHVAVFCRLSGCNVWDGDPEHRERDAAKGACAMICDTEFRTIDPEQNGGTYTAEELLRSAKTLWRWRTAEPIIVFTGGEPSLQLSEELVRKFIEAGWRVHVETNGSRPLPDIPHSWYWITLSPKPPMPVIIRRYKELKVLYPLYNPLEFEHLAARLPQHRKFIQPVAQGGAGTVAKCVEFILEHPDWALSLQAHKLIGVP